MSTTDLNTNNSAQTLFRFATMRNPELSDPKNKERRFIFRDYNTQKGKIDPRVEAGESLQKIFENPNSIAGFTVLTEEDLKTEYAPFYEYAVWVARNKATATKEEFDQKIKACKTANGIPNVNFKIWDNLVYQVVTQKDFYAKELIMQMLHLYHILSVYDFTEEVYQDVVKAKVVLPKELFKAVPSGAANTSGSTTTQRTVYNDKAMKFAQSTVNLKANEALADSLSKLEKTYKKQYEEAYKKAYADYQNQILPLQKQLRKETSAADNKKQILENRINYLTQLSVADPEKFYANSELDMELHRIKDEIMNIPVSEVEIPDFSFTYGAEINASAIERALNDEDKNTLYKLFGASSVSSALSGISTFDEINQALAQNSQSLQNTILNNTVLDQETFANIGGVVIPVGDSMSGDIPFSVKTFARNSSELSILLAVNNSGQSILSGTYKALINGNEITSSGISTNAGGANILFDLNPRISGSQTAVAEMFNLQGNVVLSDGKQYRFNVTLNVDPASIDPLTKQPVFRGSSVFTLKDSTDTTTSSCLPVALRTRSFRSYNDKWLLSMTPLETTDLFSFVTATFRVLDNNGNVVQSSTELKVIDGGDYLSLFTDGVIPKLQITDVIKAGLQLEGEFTLSNGKVYTCRIPMTPDTAAGLDGFTKTYNLSGDGRLCLKQSNNNGNTSTSTPVTDSDIFIPSGFGMRNIGIADYLKVEQSLQGYVEGEVAHIENVMARERREKATKKTSKSEITTVESSDSEKEQLRDTSSTERFEMQNEIAKAMQQTKDAHAEAHVDGSYGGISFGVSGGFATHNSKEENTKQAMTQAKEITQKATDKIVTKVHKERTEKMIEEFEETNIHEFDNRKGDKHVVGVYRWVDKVFKNQIYNYGKRMMFEFMIPEPARIHRLGMQVKGTTSGQLIKPVDPRESDVQKLENFSSLQNEATLKFWLSKYNVEVEEKPMEEFSLTKSFSGRDSSFMGQDEGKIQIVNGSGEVELPEGYVLQRVNYVFNTYPHGFNGAHQAFITIAGSGATWIDSIHSTQVSGTMEVLNVKNKLEFSFATGESPIIQGSLKLNLKLSQEYKNVWLQKTFNKIIEAYEKAKTKYEQELAAIQAQGVEIKGSNPGFYRQIENTVLRRNCISYMINQDPSAALTFGKDKYYRTNTSEESFLNTEIKLDSTLDKYTAFVKFMEQAFEWEIMSYYFYPYYWGNRNNWDKMYQFDDNDATFRAFMQSGMARVIVTVRPGFEEAVRHFMATGQIWNGGEVPVIDDKLFLSIVDEMRKTEGEKYGKAWPSRVPTALTILQAQSIGLNVTKALPFDDNLSDYEDPTKVPQSSQIVPTDSQMGGSDEQKTGSISGHIEGLQGLLPEIMLKNKDKSPVDFTNPDDKGDFWMENIPVGKYELCLDENDDFDNQYSILKGKVTRIVEVKESSTTTVYLEVKKI
jgi:hypothetical protein